MQLRIQRRADLDIEDLFRYGLETFGASVATEYYDDLMRVIRLIAAHPKMGSARPNLGLGLRAHMHRSHVIFYRIDETDLVVIRVLSTRQNWSEHLG